MKWQTVSALAVVTGLMACDTQPNPATTRRSKNGAITQNAFLRPVDGCPDLEASLKEQMTARMETRVQSQLESALQMLENPDWYCNGWCWGPVDSGMAGDAIAPCYLEDTAGGVPPPNASQGGASEYTTTNNQVAGVDEADFIKNDGEYIYVLTGESFSIIRAWPADAAAPIAKIDLEGKPTRMFVEGNRAVVYSSLGDTAACNYYDNNPVLTGQQLQVSVYDITDRAAPVLEREILLGGSYVASRRVGGDIHTVVAFPETFETSLPTWPDALPYGLCTAEDEEAITEAAVREAFDALLEQNRAAIAETDLGDFLPSALDTDHTPAGPVVEEGLFIACENFFAPTDDDTPGFLSVLSFPMADDTKLEAATIFGRAGEVYASAHSLYVSSIEYRDSDEPNEWGTFDRTQHTVLHKFGLGQNGAAPFYAASGSVPGRLLNQFAMDEHQGRLRIAVTEGWAFDPDAQNALYVLEERIPNLDLVLDPACGQLEADGCEVPVTFEPELVIIGAVTNIAPTEDIRSVRFDGDRGFVVTFKKTDPLYAFDLSNPREPRITGELKIPGFSTYMHFMDDDHLLTIGFDADDQGTFAWFQGIILQIFDVSDPANMVLTHKETIGTRGTTSDATDDHMAFTYMPSKGLLAVPMGICEGGDGGSDYGSQLTFNGLLVYGVDAATGFTALGGVDHREAEAEPDPYGYNSGCYTWWQNPNSQVKRSIIMADAASTAVYSVSTEKLKVNDLTDLSTDLQAIDLPQGEGVEEPYCYGW